MTAPLGSGHLLLGGVGKIWSFSQLEKKFGNLEIFFMYKTAWFNVRSYAPCSLNYSSSSPPYSMVHGLFCIMLLASWLFWPPSPFSRLPKTPYEISILSKGPSIFAYGFSNLHNVQIQTDTPTHPSICMYARRKVICTADIFQPTHPP